jgi:hypothetical protein
MGVSHYYPNEWALIDREMLEKFEAFVKPYKVKQRYFYTEWAQMGKPWREHTDRDFALSIKYKEEIGTQSIGIFEIEK